MTDQTDTATPAEDTSPEAVAPEAAAAPEAAPAAATEAAPAAATEAAPEAEAAAPAEDAPAHTSTTGDAPVEDAAPARATSSAVGQASEGHIVTGKVVRLADFGAFVDIPGPGGKAVTGLVHISEVATGFVDNIFAHLTVDDDVDVKVLSFRDDGKIELSIRQADPEFVPDEDDEAGKPRRSKLDKNFDRRLRKFMHGSQSIQGEARRQRRDRRTRGR